MTKWMPIFILLFATTACQGTLELDDGTSLQDGTSSLTAGPAATTDLPADTATAVATPAATTPTPQTETPPTTTEEPPAEEPAPEETPTEPEEPALPEPGSVVEFQIAQGTGQGAWNTPETAVVVYVGQMLKLTNFDDRNHRMHAADNAAVPHGGDLQPGQSQEYLVDTPMAVGTEARLWDHNDGRSAPFWVEAREYPAP